MQSCSKIVLDSVLQDSSTITVDATKLINMKIHLLNVSPVELLPVNEPRLDKISFRVEKKSQ